MTLDYRNLNLLWASALMETLWRLGLKQVVVCPGSRSGPLAVAAANHPHIEAVPILDERSASFFALGHAKPTGRAVAVVCTSGTAGVNMYPAVIEATEGRVPLLVLTADRPPELRDCGAGQTVDQQKLFGVAVRWYHEVALPDRGRLDYLRQTAVQAWNQAHNSPGPVHLNVVFRDPLAPVDMGEDLPPLAEDFFTAIAPPRPPKVTLALPPLPPKGLIIAGVAAPHAPEAYCQAVAQLSQRTGYPVLAEGLSPMRNWAALQPHLVTAYDSILRAPSAAAALTPDAVIQLGPLPTSKVLRQWLTDTAAPRYLISPTTLNLDPTHGHTQYLRGEVTQLALSEVQRDPATHTYAQQWSGLEAQARQQLNKAIATADFGIESGVAWRLSQHLPPQTPLFVANSTPVRDVEWFWAAGDRHIVPYVNRGANGIDGNLSAALGVAHRNRPGVFLTGDLALLHDTNGFLIHSYFQGHLTIVLVNNGGGGIFELLPIAQFDPPFTEFFITPQQVDVGLLCQSYGVEYQRMDSWDALTAAISRLPETGVRLLEVPCDRRRSAQWRQDLFRRIANFL